MTKGGVVQVLALGGVSAMCLLVMLPKWLRGGTEKPPVTGLPAKALLARAARALALPALLFWLLNPTLARHFILPLVGLYLLLGLCCAGWISTHARALWFAVLLVAGNQVAAELMHLLVSRHYPWSYDASGLRRATQQAPLGLCPLG